MATGSRLSYSPSAVRVGAGIYLLFALWWLGALLIGPDPAHALEVGCWLLAVGVVVYALFWRPAVVVDDEGVLLRNVLRDVHVPWSLLEAIETRFALTLVTPDGRHQSWAAAAPGRPSTLPGRPAGVRGRGLLASVFQPSGADGGHQHALPRPSWLPGETAAGRSSQDLTADSGAAAFMVRQRWVAWQDANPPSRRGPGAEETAQVRVSWVAWQPAAVAALALAGGGFAALGL